MSVLVGVLVPGLFGSLMAPCAFAGVDEVTAGYTFNYFSDVDGLSVFTHYGNSGLKLDNNLKLDVEWVHDVVVFPAIDAAPGSQEAVDAITTASRPLASTTDPFSDFVKVRNSIEGNAAFGGGNAGYYVSKESDYFAQMVSVGYNRGFLGDNLNVAAGMSYSWDRIDPLDDEDTQSVPDKRRTVHWNLVVTQVVTPTTVVRVGAEINRVDGLQHAPYRNVYVAGVNVPERHPNERLRRDAFLHVSQYLNNLSSIKFDFRYYTDDWGVTSQTYGTKLNQYVTDALIVRYRYRYYRQSAAWFYRDEYTGAGGVDGYQTNDYRLEAFAAHLFGGRVMWRPDPLIERFRFLDRVQLIFSYERYFNSNNFSANIFETGLRVTY